MGRQRGRSLKSLDTSLTKSEEPVLKPELAEESGQARYEINSSLKIRDIGRRFDPELRKIT